MFGTLALAGIAGALMSNPRKRRKARRRNPYASVSDAWAALRAAKTARKKNEIGAWISGHYPSEAWKVQAYRRNPPYRYLSGKTCVSPTSGLTYNATNPKRRRK